jgi:tyrosine-protein kinase Etk/Wzc
MTEQSQSEKISLLEYLHYLVKIKYVFITHFFIVTIFALIISLIVPKTYTATATILPANESADMMGLSSLLSDLPSIGGLGGLTTLSNDGVTLMAIVKSRTVADSVIQKFSLQEYYKMPTMVETRKALAKNVVVSPTEEGAIQISIKAKTKYFSFGQKDRFAQNFCRNIADYYVQLLDKLNKDLRMEKGRNQRVFIEKRVEENIADLTKAEDRFGDFQKKYGVIAIEEQTKASIEVMAQLKGMITSKEVELGYKTKYLSESNSDVENTRKELLAMSQKYRQLTNAGPSTEAGESGAIDAFLPLNKVPDLGMEYARLYRELLIQEKIREFLIPMYEQAKIQEAKDTPSLQIIDRPIIPDKKSSPKRAIIILLAGFACILFTIIYTYLAVNYTYLQEYNPRAYRKLAAIRDDLTIRKK